MAGNKPLVFLGLVGLLLVVSAALGAAWYWYANPGATTQEGEVCTDCSEAASETADVRLDQEQREYIWQIEHHVLLVGKQWFHELGEAWGQADAAAVLAMFAGDFQGQAPCQPSREELKTDFAHVVRLKDSGQKPSVLDREGFVSLLLNFRKIFHSRPRVKVFAKTMEPAARARLDGPWQGVGVARMWGEIRPGEPAEVVLQFNFQIPRPVRASQAGWFRRARLLQSQVSTSRKPLLRDVTRERGIDPDMFHDNWKEEYKLSTSGGVYVCDFNRDGLLDILVVDPKGNHLFQGEQGGKFRDVLRELGLPAVAPPESVGRYAAFADLDGDGWEDLILQGRFYRNCQGRFFKDYTHKCNLRLDPEATGIVVGDFDRDGKLDLYSTKPGVGKACSWLDGKSGRDSGNQLWRNLGDWKFQDVTAQSGTAGGSRSVFSAVWFDANDDGWPDLYVPNEFGHGVLLVNQKDGTFREHVIGNPPGDFGTMGITCGDVNNDGKVDLYLGNMYSKTGARIIGNVRPGTYPHDVMAKMRRFVTGSQLYLNRGDLKFEPVAQSWQMNDIGWAYGPALIDLDNDGFLDVFATSGFMSFDRSEPDG